MKLKRLVLQLDGKVHDELISKEEYQMLIMSGDIFTVYIDTPFGPNKRMYYINGLGKREAWSCPHLTQSIEEWDRLVDECE